jgi:hypothetical protein
MRGDSVDRQRLSAMQRERFPELPLDCGNDDEPGIRDTHEWRDWSELGTTGSQLRIEDYLDRLGVVGKSILHIGIGNSGLARRFADQTSNVVGTTIVASEVEKAATLGLRSYTAVLHNKYSGEMDSVPGRFDYVVDNNPNSYCCCLEHLGLMLEFYASKLLPKGQVVTDRMGIAWTFDGPERNSRWQFCFDDLAAVAELAGLRAYRATDDIYVLARRPPARPTLVSMTSYWLRKAIRKLSRAPARAKKLLAR